MIQFSKQIKRILVTGGSGFIGSNLIRKLLNQTNIKVFNLDKVEYTDCLETFELCKDSNNYKLLNIDIFNETDVKEAIDISNPDLVFHLAAETHVDKSISVPKLFLNSNIIGTFNLLEALLNHWKSLTESRRNQFRFLHVSTDEVFGSTDGNSLFTEQTRYDPKSPYSATKAASDHLVRSWNNTFEFPVIVTNSCNNFGPWQFPEKLVPVIIKQALSSKSIPIYGDGMNVRDWIFVEDHINALIAVILKGKIGETYCISAGQLKTNEEILKSICDLLDIYNKGNSPHIRFKKYVKDRPGHDQRYALDNRKIINELKWQPKYNFHEGIELTVKWYLNNTQWLNQLL